MPDDDNDVPPTKAAARALVGRVANYDGNLGDDIFRKMVSEETILQDSIIKSNAITLSENLYNNPARFAFEMLRNADDGSFSRSRARGEEPYVNFDVASRYITFECNEDSFTNENITAICSTSKRSKMGTQGYIDEKGKGFVSVLTVDYKAHTQSETPPSSLLHRRGDSGISIASPVQEDQEIRPGIDIAKITIFLINSLDVETEGAENPIMEQFRHIQETYLLFTKNIRCVKVNFIRDDESVISSTIYSIRSFDNLNRVSLVKKQDRGSEIIANYYVTRFIAGNLPPNENRKYSDAENAVQAWSSSEVVLGFPLDGEGRAPKAVPSQQVFAFLPIRNIGLKFLIQADFVTQTGHQDVVTSSSRNQALCKGIADAFSKAMKELCADDFLRYTWLRYLPVRTNYLQHGYWLSLYDCIKNKVQATVLIRSLNEGSPYNFVQMRRGSSHSDAAGDPVSEDIGPNMYFSGYYLTSDLVKISNHYGLRLMGYNEILMQVSADLKDPDSRMKSTATSPEWHENAAMLLHDISNKSDQLFQAVKELDVIPLQSGEWTSAKSVPFPLTFQATDDGLSIPEGLRLSLISSSASKCISRANLYKLLGATQLSTSKVRRLILNQYPIRASKPPWFSGSAQASEISIAHLKFLYQTDILKPANPNHYHRLSVLTEERGWVAPWLTDIYILNDHRYGAKSLLQPTSRVDSSRSDAPGFDVVFLPSNYMVEPSFEEKDDDNSSEEQKWMRSTDSWFDWLLNCISVRSHPRLFDDHEGFTDIFRYIIKYRETEILGLLQYQWPIIEGYVSNRRTIQNMIANIHVPLPYHNNRRGWQLKKTYLPLPELKVRFSQYAGDVRSNNFPFLDFRDTLAPNDLSEWAFLQVYFGVGNSDNLRFYLDVLSTIKCRSTPYKKVFDLYRVIHEKASTSDSVPNARKLVRSYFEEFCLILLPATEDLWGRGCQWRKPESCRWDSPERFISIKASYAASFEGDSAWETILTAFMRETIGIKDFNWIDIVDDIREHARMEASWQEFSGIEPDTTEGDEYEEAISIMYNQLDSLRTDLKRKDRDKLRKVFSTKSLIRAAGGWHKTSACVWSNEITVSGKVQLNTYWPAMRALFVDLLGVSAQEMVIIAQPLPDRHAAAQRRRPEISIILSGSNNVDLIDDLGALHEFEYVNLLDKVIKLARAAHIQPKANVDMPSTEAAVGGSDRAGNGGEEYFKMRSAQGVERDKMIGAAGELYVFELLKNANTELPLLSEANWKSTIRKYVKVHQDYAAMEPWTGNEKADLEYNDCEGVLTKLLIDKGHLDKESWVGRKPYYYIEVKSTTKACEAPFYMSKAQYTRMKNIANGPRDTGERDEIYVVFRVFNLGMDSIGCTIYVDPESMRAQGALDFTPNTWMVVPRRSA
ncbi:hypothetical protein F4803DRAFT_573525 [Xylaria telfairii]|nr:hypothetical protein F4803DRAFT_573525 [Xylaria telfairii]